MLQEMIELLTERNHMTLDVHHMVLHTKSQGTSLPAAASLTLRVREADTPTP